MIIPNFATDNLYKFIALAGLTLAVVSIVISTIEMKELSGTSAETAYLNARLEESLGMKWNEGTVA